MLSLSCDLPASSTSSPVASWDSKRHLDAQCSTSLKVIGHLASFRLLFYEYYEFRHGFHLPFYSREEHMCFIVRMYAYSWHFPGIAHLLLAA